MTTREQEQPRNTLGQTLEENIFCLNAEYHKECGAPLSPQRLDYLRRSVCFNPDGTWYRMSEEEFHSWDRLSDSATVLR